MKSHPKKDGMGWMWTAKGGNRRGPWPQVRAPEAQPFVPCAGRDLDMPAHDWSRRASVPTPRRLQVQVQTPRPHGKTGPRLAASFSRLLEASSVVKGLL